MSNLLIAALGGLAIGGIAGAMLAKDEGDKKLLLAAGAAGVVGVVAISAGSVPAGVGLLGVGGGLALVPLLNHPPVPFSV